MRKIIFLCGCILAVLLLCFFDGGRQKERRFQDAWMVNAWPEQEGESDAEEMTESETISDRTEIKEQKIRVLIKTAGYASVYHEKIQLTSAGAFSVSDGQKIREYQPESMLEITAQDFGPDPERVLRLESGTGSFEVDHLLRDRTGTDYRGILEIRNTDNGLLLINELPLEEYLCAVVPSEMPSSYPEEALKAQAVCARTYAMRQIQQGRAQEFFADVDDSVSYQVYNNQDRTGKTDQAVYDTKGLVLKEGENLIDALYYSTSCGRNTKMDLSAEAVFASFLTDSTLAAYEAEEPWFRWQTYLSLEAKPEVLFLEVTERRPDGAVELLEAEFESGEHRLIRGEYEIRRYLAEFQPVVTLQNGEEKSGLALLPSAFIVLQPQYEEETLAGYTVLGGGYGHGNGMSQNGAKQMALRGVKFEDILAAYYDTARIEEM